MAALLHTHAFGLQITDGLIKFAELSYAKNSFRIIAYGERLLPPSAITDGAINDADLVVKEIRQLLQNPLFGQVSTNYVVCSLPESRIFLKTISLPKFSKTQIKEAILWEAKSVLPIPSEKAYYQTQILEEHDKTVEALVAATEQKLVDDYLSVLHLAGLTPIAFDLECYAALRTIQDDEVKKRTLIQVHIGNNVTMLTVLKHSQVWFSHALPTGTNTLTKDIALERNISVDEARIVRDNEGFNALKTDKTITSIASGIVSTLKFYEQNLGKENTHIDGVIFTGGYSSLPGLIQHLSTHITNIPVSIAKPRLSFSNELITKYKLSPLLISFGLALRGASPIRWESDLNFLPETFITQLELRESTEKNIRLLSILGYISLCVSIILGFSLWLLYSDLKTVDRRITQQKDLVEHHSAHALFPKIEEANKQFQLISNLETLRLPFHTILPKITDAVPEGIQLTSLNFTQGKKRFDINGVARSRTHILAFAQRLEKDPGIKDITVLLGSFNKDQEALFTLSLAIQETNL